jgi:Ca2+-binding RTX toxin-like protein
MVQDLSDPSLPNLKSIINMGNGNDIITGTGSGYGILNDGEINMGGGNDKVTANSGFGGNGSVFLGAGNDYLKGFGSGNFNGGSGKDTLELTKGPSSDGVCVQFRER